MDTVLRATVIYFVLLLLIRISGRRSLSELTAFDFVLLLVIGEATQQALLGEDFSITNAILVILTLIGIDIGLSLVKRRWQLAAKLIEGVPMVIVDNGKLLHDRMNKARLTEDDVLEAGRRLHGLERVDQIKYAVLEVGGGITIVPK